MAAQLGYATTFSIDIYSISDVNVSLNPSTSAVHQTIENSSLTYQSAIENTVVQISVFGKEVSAHGLKAVISLTVHTQDGFGNYTVNVNNDVGSTAASVTILPESMCKSFLLSKILTHKDP